jgi:hypothetical protein
MCHMPTFHGAVNPTISVSKFWKILQMNELEKDFFEMYRRMWIYDTTALEEL